MSGSRGLGVKMVKWSVFAVLLAGWVFSISASYKYSSDLNDLERKIEARDVDIKSLRKTLYLVARKTGIDEDMILDSLITSKEELISKPSTQGGIALEDLITKKDEPVATGNIEKEKKTQVRKIFLVQESVVGDIDPKTLSEDKLNSLFNIEEIGPSVGINVGTDTPAFSRSIEKYTGYTINLKKVSNLPDDFFKERLVALIDILPEYYRFKDEKGDIIISIPQDLIDKVKDYGYTDYVFRDGLRNLTEKPSIFYKLTYSFKPEEGEEQWQK